MPYSLLILTKDEELNIARCIGSTEPTDIWVLDSDSDDETQNLALSFGARLETRAFDNYASQRNHGLSFDFAEEWILCLDADECLPLGGHQDLEDLIADLDASVDIVCFLRRDYLNNRWLRGATGYPTFFPRLFRKGTVSVCREINEIYNADGETYYCRNLELDHYPFEKGIDEWILKHCRYATMEAKLLALDSGAGSAEGDSYFEKRQQLKALYYRLPIRPVISFLYFFFWKRGFMAGVDGLHYSLLRACYEVFIDVKVRNLRSRLKNH